jgi:hypothetical protein
MVSTFASKSSGDVIGQHGVMSKQIYMLLESVAMLVVPSKEGTPGTDGIAV